ncbi:MAG: hypothetical protein II264_04110, partial [Ruminococcus sp.]|nr:hypothetical protein [Ruminococcus sp.]
TQYHSGKLFYPVHRYYLQCPTSADIFPGESVHFPLRKMTARNALVNKFVIIISSEFQKINP